MKFRFLSAISATLLAAMLAACGSSVKLYDVPVESRTGTSVTPTSGSAPGDPAGVSNRTVQPVQIDGADVFGVGPVAVARVIYFDYDSYVIKPEFQSAIEAHAKYLAANKSRKLAIEGNTDERGGREYNLALGQKRAEAVRRGLGLLGVTDAQVEAVSFGEEKPVAAGPDESSLAKNRRAELNYR
ncbi:MAG: peptidoglycan-associated lipoprotein Pal [Polaromonas sp.]|nr:MAG: peptidoglycan-associated lipoprotein Pal [Polaromonas sp.]